MTEPGSNLGSLAPGLNPEKHHTRNRAWHVPFSFLNGHFLLQHGVWIEGKDKKEQKLLQKASGLILERRCQRPNNISGKAVGKRMALREMAALVIKRLRAMQSSQMRCCRVPLATAGLGASVTENCCAERETGSSLLPSLLPRLLPIPSSSHVRLQCPELSSGLSSRCP